MPNHFPLWQCYLQLLGATMEKSFWRFWFVGLLSISHAVKGNIFFSGFCFCFCFFLKGCSCTRIAELLCCVRRDLLDGWRASLESKWGCSAGESFLECNIRQKHSTEETCRNHACWETPEKTQGTNVTPNYQGKQSDSPKNLGMAVWRTGNHMKSKTMGKKPSTTRAE